MRQVLHGAIAMGGLTIGLFFLRFYRDRRDALFAYFGAAFLLIGATNAALGFSSDAAAEMRVYIYLLRLLAFVLIIVGIIVKNRASS